MDHSKVAQNVSPFQCSIQQVEPISSNEITPTKPSRTGNNQLRSRGMSRSTSVPSAMYLKASDTNDRTTPLTPNDLITARSTRNSTSSVRHLTCFWWKEKGSCRFADDDCLYAHHDTGHYTEPPRQLIPGEPALAGRKLDRAMRNLSITPRSSASLSSAAGSRHESRPGTPVFDFTSPLVSPSPSQNQGYDFVRLSNDNLFLKGLVDQSGKEKALMINTIETLQSDNKSMKTELEGLKKTQAQLLEEREALRGRIQLLEHQNMPTRSVSHPFGTIGRARVNTEARCIGGLLNNE